MKVLLEPTLIQSLPAWLIYICAYYFVQDKVILKGFKKQKHSNCLYKSEKVTLLFKMSENRGSYREKSCKYFWSIKIFPIIPLNQSLLQLHIKISSC